VQPVEGHLTSHDSRQWQLLAGVTQIAVLAGSDKKTKFCAVTNMMLQIMMCSACSNGGSSWCTEEKRE
jgi:hypothetical protein